MALFEKKQELGQAKPAPPPKEEKKDLSAFGGKPFLKREEVRSWLKRDEAWRISKGMPREERIKLEKKLFPQKFGEYIEPKEAEKVYRDLKNFPEKSKKEYGLSGSERYRALELLKKFLGK